MTLLEELANEYSVSRHFTVVAEIDNLDTYIANPTPEQWLRENIGERYKKWEYLPACYWLFTNEDDAALFKLTWG